MITGHLRPTKGTIRFEGRDITGLPSREITRLGISRSFQVAQIFPVAHRVRQHVHRRRRSRAARGGFFGRVVDAAALAGGDGRGGGRDRAVSDRGLSRRARAARCRRACASCSTSRMAIAGCAAAAAARRADQRHLDRGEIRHHGRGDVGAQDAARSPCCSSSTTWRSSGALPSACSPSTTARVIADGTPRPTLADPKVQELITGGQVRAARGGACLTSPI